MLGAVASTAIHKDAAADQSSSSGAMIGIAGDALHRDQHAAAAANPCMACVREEHPYMACVHEGEHRPRGCCGRSRKTKMMLAASATFLIVLGVALGLGLHFGLQKGKASGVLGTNLYKATENVACPWGRRSDLHLDSA
jgi:hypothetical protein